MKLLRLYLTICGLLIAAWACFAQLPHGAIKNAHAQSPMSMTGMGLMGPQASGGGSASFAAVSAKSNTSCGFPSSCNAGTTFSINAGYVIAAVWANTAGGTNDLTGVTACGATLSKALTVTGSPAAGFPIGLWYSTSTVASSSSCTVTLTYGSNALQEVAAAIGTLANPVSDAPTGSSCYGYYAASEPSPYPCTSGTVTVPSSGFVVCVAGNSLGNAITWSSPLTYSTVTDSNNLVSMGSANSGSGITPQWADGSYAQAGIGCDSWH